MTTWQPMPDCVFNSTGFMSGLGSSPHAWACTACARPISPPPGQTAALFDMFCDLKGATRTPARANTRHSAVTTTVLPTYDAVPITIKLLALKTRFLLQRRSRKPYHPRCDRLFQYGYGSTRMEVRCSNATAANGEKTEYDIAA